MASVVGICNSALTKLGATRIIQMTEGSKNANLCNEQYDKVKDDLLRSHVWNFAVRRTKLAQLAETPTFGFDYVYQLPSDFIRLVSVHPDDSGRCGMPYKIEGKKLLTDVSDVYLRYVYEVTDPNEMDALFRETLAWSMALDLAIPITQSSTTREQMKDGLRSQISRAKSVDAIEDYPELEPQPQWVTERA